jgi:glycosyltransferase involved in cell wall biosynthesis
MTRLLNINNYHYRRGGAEVVFLEQTRLFERAGWDVAEFSMHHPMNEPSVWSEYFVDEVELGGEYGPLEKAVRVGRAVYSPQARRRLARLLDDVVVDIAHVHNVYHHLSPAVLPVLAKRGIPVVLTTHDLKMACPAKLMLSHDGVCERCRDGNYRHVVANRCVRGSATLSALAYVESVLHRELGSYVRHVDRFVSPSRFFIDKFAQWGFEPDQFVYIPNFIDSSTTVADTTPGRYVVYFGRLSVEKGLLTLVRAAAAARVPLVLAGTGPQEAELRQLAADLGGDVTFTGFLAGDALHDLVRSARVSVLPSECYENAPLGVMESYALGTPVIGARIGGITELVREQETGFCFSSGVVEELTEVLERVMALPDHQVDRSVRQHDGGSRPTSAPSATCSVWSSCTQSSA